MSRPRPAKPDEGSAQPAVHIIYCRQLNAPAAANLLRDVGGALAGR